MTPADVLILALLALVTGTILMRLWKRRRSKGAGCLGCSGCPRFGKCNSKPDDQE
jgi:hypothetical protein